MEQHLDEEKPKGVVNEALEQIAFADRIVLNKTDLVGGVARFPSICVSQQLASQQIASPDRAVLNKSNLVGQACLVNVSTLLPTPCPSPPIILPPVLSYPLIPPLLKVTNADLERLEDRIRSINSLAHVQRAQRSAVPLDYVLGVGGFDLEKVEEEVRKLNELGGFRSLPSHCHRECLLG